MKTLIAAMLLVGLPAIAQVPPVERVLLPIVITDQNGVPGAHGSLFKTSLVAFNANDEVVRITDQPGTICLLPTPNCSEAVAAPRSAIVPFELTASTAAPGTFQHIVFGRRGGVRFHLRVQDVSRQALTYGTELPVVRETEFEREVQLLDVPLQERFRQTLRIYDFDGRESTPVRIRVFDAQATGDLVAERSVLLTGGKVQQGYPSKPAYLQLGDIIAEFPETIGRQQVRIEVAALDSATRIWAFVSVTNNETQHITLITP